MRYPGHKILFIHIPRTGGTSVATRLRQAFGKENGHHQHSTLQQYVDRLGKQEVDKHFVLSIVRNPWDRMVSWYARNHEMRPPEKFEEWLTSLDFSKQQYWNQVDYLTVGGVMAVDRIFGFEELQAFWNYYCYGADIDHKHWSLPHRNKSTRLADHRQYYTERTRDLVAQVYKRDIQKFGYEF